MKTFAWEMKKCEFTLRQVWMMGILRWKGKGKAEVKIKGNSTRIKLIGLICTDDKVSFIVIKKDIK